MSSLPWEFFARDVEQVARGLLGKVLLRGGVGGPIVEVEAYHQDEPACHGHRGRTARNASLFLPGGHLYVYRIHQSLCANVVTGEAGVASAVLIRALLPAYGRSRIARRRRGQPQRGWCDGPGKLCQALLLELPTGAVHAGPRIGISRARELPWRFLVSRAGQAALHEQLDAPADR